MAGWYLSRNRRVLKKGLFVVGWTMMSGIPSSFRCLFRPLNDDKETGEVEMDLSSPSKVVVGWNE